MPNVKRHARALAGLKLKARPNRTVGGKHPNIVEWVGADGYIVALDTMGALHVFKPSSWKKGNEAEYYFQPGDETDNLINNAGGHYEWVPRYLKSAGYFQNNQK